MITEKQYLKAKKIIDAYNKQLELEKETKYIELLKCKKGDYITYLGGSKSKNLIIGKKYRLTCEPWNKRVAVINETGKRKVYKDRLFSV